MTDLRSGIMADLVTTLAGTEGIVGVIDDVPWDYAQPPQPAPGHGTNNRDGFAYVFEGEEAPNLDEFPAQYSCELPITIEVSFEYSLSDPFRGLKRVGRELLARIQRRVMADPNRGGRAQLTAETFNAVEETTVEGLGVIIWRGVVEYVRARTNPDSLEAA